MHILAAILVVVVLLLFRGRIKALFEVVVALAIAAWFIWKGNS